MKARRVDLVAFALVAIGAVLTGSAVASADGTETLGSPTVELAAGSGVAVGGVGLYSQPGSLVVEIPADATVQQALLYFETGSHDDGVPHDTITVNGEALTCPLIGGPTFFYGDVYSSTHRCDITDRDLIKAGVTSLTVGGLPDGDVNDGAGVMVIYRQPGKNAAITLVDGTDTAFVDFPGDRRSTVPQTFTFEESTVARTATMALMVGSIANHTAPDFTARPSTLRLVMGDETVDIADPFNGEDDGAQFDARLVDITIPPGVDSITAQLLSEYGGDGLPASLVWIMGSLSVPAPTPGTGTGPSQVSTPPPNGANPAPVAVTPAPSASAPAPSTPVFVAQQSTTVPVVVAAQLPVTGGETEQRGILGAAVLACGLALLAGSRRREALR